MTEGARRSFSEDDLFTWRTILVEHRKKRGVQICEIFNRGLEILGVTEDRIPSLEEVNAILRQYSGFRGVFVQGLEDAAGFYGMLARREFPVGNFIRDRRDIGYTPAPDIVHDLYGHLPYFTDQAYGDFCQGFSEDACRVMDRPDLLRQYERFFWFTIEFGLVKTSQGVRVFGAGIASSTAECDYALSGTPEVLPFNIDAIRHQEFRIDIMQPRLFCLESPEQLYSSLPELSRRVRADA